MKTTKGNNRKAIGIIEIEKEIWKTSQKSVKKDMIILVGERFVKAIQLYCCMIKLYWYALYCMTARGKVL